MQLFETKHLLEPRYSAHSGRTTLATGVALASDKKGNVMFKDTQILANFNWRMNSECLIRYTERNSLLMKDGFAFKVAELRKNQIANPDRDDAAMILSAVRSTRRAKKVKANE